MEEIEVAAQIWAHVMPKEMTDQQFKAALHIVVGHAKFFPTPGDVTAAWKDVVAKEVQQTRPSKVLPFEGTTAHKDQCEKNKAKARAILDRLKKKMG